MDNAERNVQVLQDLYAALLQGDWEGVLSRLTEDVELVYHGPSDMMMAGIYRGRDEVRRFFELVAANVDRSPEDCGAEVRHVVAQGDTVVAIGNDRVCWGPGKDRYDGWWVHLFQFQDGKICRAEEFVDTHQSMALTQLVAAHQPR